MAISHVYWHLVIKNGNFILLLTLVVKHGNFTLLLTSSSQQWQFCPIQHYQRTEWSLHCSMLSLRLKGRYTLLVQYYQRTEWSLYYSMLSLTLKGRYSPLVNTIRGQSDLFTVQCCNWHSKADIPPPSTVAEDRVISLLFNVVIETQRQPGQHYQRTEWSLHCSMLSLTLKGRYTPIQHYQRPEWSLHCSVLTLRLKGRYTPPSFEQ